MIRSILLLGCLAAPLLPPEPAEAAPGPRPGPRPDASVIRVAAVAIEAPATVDPGEEIQVAVPGASGGRLEIWGPVTEHGRGNMLAGGEMQGQSAPVTAPNIPGSYELRYFGPGGALQARRELEVAAVPLRLWVPEQFSAGIPGEVRWRGPARPGDVIQIVDATSGAVAVEVPAEGAPGAENVTIVEAPAEPGQYRLRYVSRERGAVLRTLPVEVGPSHSWMGLPPRVGAGESFTVQWYGPVREGNAFEIVDPARDAVVESMPAAVAQGGASAVLNAPGQPGEYRVRLVDTETGRVRSNLPLTVN